MFWSFEKRNNRQEGQEALGKNRKPNKKARWAHMLRPDPGVCNSPHAEGEENGTSRGIQGITHCSVAIDNPV